VATEILRRVIPQPPIAAGWELIYWFADRVLFDGKWLVLFVMAMAPHRENLPLKILAPAAGLLLMAGSILQLQDPLYLILLGLLLGAMVKSLTLTEPALMLMAMGGMFMGLPINGFTGLMVAKANFPPALMKPLFGATAGVGCASVAISMAGLFLLGRRVWSQRNQKH